jgi:methyl-accepting chemotaxis protein
MASGSLAPSPAPGAPDAPTPAKTPVPADAAAFRSTRRVRNYLLDTGLQLRLASYLLGVATLLSGGLGWLLWRAWRETSAILELSATELDASVGPALAGEDRVRIVLVAIALALVLVCLLAAAVVITHRIAGPAYALGLACRRVADGDLSPPRPLRARDLLVDLGDEVTGMVTSLREREQAERERLLRLAAKLKDPAATAADRAAAVAALEALAAEKERRLSP